VGALPPEVRTLPLRVLILLPKVRALLLRVSVLPLSMPEKGPVTKGIYTKQ
jgi:hypothetical protein